MRQLNALDKGLCTLVLVSLFLLSGCAGRPASVVNAYEVPVTVDLKQVMDVVEQSTAQVLGRPVTITEGALPAVLPFVASPAVVERTRRTLDGLGVVVIPHIHCPGSIATVEKLLASHSGLRIVAACISPTQTATVIQLMKASAEEGRTSSAISSVGQVLLERLSGGRSIERPIVVTGMGGFLQESHFVAKGDGANTSMAPGAAPGFTAVPLVCFAPRTLFIAVQTGPDDSMTMDALKTELIVNVESPINTGYVHVETRDGVAGWVKRSDVRWTPCPIG
jgi:hypothetical protein